MDRARIGRRSAIVWVSLAAQACFYSPTGSEAVTTIEAATDSTGEAGSTTRSGSTTASTTAASTTEATTGESPVDPTAASAGSSTAEATSEPAAVCGDGVVGGAEECDDGNLDDADACTNACALAVCGDAIVGRGEACDDGPASMHCDEDCTLPICGDGVVNAAAGEACDDGGVKGGACSPACAWTRIVDLSLGEWHTCALLEGGVLRCWGSGAFGKLGSESLESLGDDPAELPTVNVDAGGPVIGVGCGVSHTCALLEGGAVRCWGENETGGLGYGHTSNLGDKFDDMPTATVDVGAVVSQVVGSEGSTCARTLEGRVRCWGSGNHLGYPLVEHLGDEPGELPTPDLADIVGASSLSLGGGRNCAVAQGEVWCWYYGVPALIDVGAPVAHVAAAPDHVCALLTDGYVRCWGQGNDGRLGYGNTQNIEDTDIPDVNVDVGGTAKQVVVGRMHSCALLTTGKVKCWGKGYAGALGSGSTTNIGDSPEEMPPPDVDLGGDARAIFAHLGFSMCAVLEDESLRCWGSNGSGQLGYGHTSNIGDDETPASAGPVPF